MSHSSTDFFNNSPGSLIIGYHGCPKDIIEEVIHNRKPLKPSKNDYDWLGNGIYFWENDPERALEWARETCKRKGGEPGVVGAVINLGNCLDFTSRKALKLLKITYKQLIDRKLPENEGVFKRRDNYLIKYLKEIQQKNGISYDSVRSVFIEGEPICPGSTFRDKNHIQIAVINPACIKAYFIPKGY
ncbi:MAG: hypothetical protein IJT92_03455 [Spirochaetia bacterium]|nr:hypothetical protein [Spirochaetia bacterium]MBR0318935.1 hypothetical protein [Spirochaetia bacterium]